MWSYTCIASHVINIPLQGGTSVVTDEHRWTHHNHPRSIVYLRATLGGVNCIDLDNPCIMDCHVYSKGQYMYKDIYHYIIIVFSLP